MAGTQAPVERVAETEEAPLAAGVEGTQEVLGVAERAAVAERVGVRPVAAVVRPVARVAAPLRRGLSSQLRREH